MVERHYAPRSYNQIYYGLRAFFEVFLPDVPLMINFRRHKTHKHNVEILTRTEIERMLRHTENIKHRTEGRRKENRLSKKKGIKIAGRLSLIWFLLMCRTLHANGALCCRWIP